MLKEEYEAAVSPKREEIYEFFKSQCLETQTEYLTEANVKVDTIKAVKVRVTSKGKCIDYKEVKEIDKKTKKETMSFSVTKKDTIFTIGTKNPTFPGGDEALVKYISTNVKYPAAAASKNITGTAFVQFVVTKQGAIKNIKVVRSPDESTKLEAIRLIKSMPKWIPGEYKSGQVSMVHSIPIRFVKK
jgi:TonB family protein